MAITAYWTTEVHPVEGGDRGWDHHPGEGVLMPLLAPGSVAYVLLAALALAAAMVVHVHRQYRRRQGRKASRELLDGVAAMARDLKMSLEEDEEIAARLAGVPHQERRTLQSTDSEATTDRHGPSWLDDAIQTIRHDQSRFAADDAVETIRRRPPWPAPADDHHPRPSEETDRA